MTEYVLTVRELDTGCLAIDGLPKDRTERQSVTWRLRDTLRAVQHASLNRPEVWRDWAGDRGRAYARGSVLRVYERPDGRIGVKGLPLALRYRVRLLGRLLDALREIQDADDILHEGSGVLWQRYAKSSYTSGWLPEATVRLVRASR